MNWINYIARCDGRPIAIKIDLAYQNSNERANLPELVIAWLKGFDVDARGFPSKSAFSRSLYPFEDDFSKLAAKHGGALVLTGVDAVTASYAAYLPEGARISVELEKLGKATGLNLKIGGNVHSNWSEYDTMLPSEEQLGFSADSKLLYQLGKLGDNPKRPREVHFVVDFERAEDANNAADALAAIGRVTIYPEIPSAQVTRTMPIELNELGAVRSRLMQIGAEYGGKYDGWGCTPQLSPIRTFFHRLEMRAAGVRDDSNPLD